MEVISLENAINFIESEMRHLENELRKSLKTRNKTVENALMQLVDSGGKRLRPRLTILGAAFGDYDRAEIIPVAAAIEIIHMATLVHDDIIDDAKLRRGTKTIQSKLGKDVAVYSGDFLFTRAFMLLADSTETHLLKDIARGISFICDGEILQNEQKYDKNITARKYLKRIGGKTATLFAVSLAAGAYKAKCPEKLVKKLGILGKNIGMAFQIVDDILDLTGAQTKVGKPLFSDTAQGVYTLPIVYCLNSSYRVNTIEAIDKINEDQGQRLKKVLLESGSIEKAKAIAKTYINKAIRITDELPEAIGKQLIIDIICKQLERKF